MNELRRTTKPIMEKRRRARINNSLNELKNLVLDYMKTKDSARHNKLEKADILEMAVRHVQTLQRQMSTQRAVSDPQVGDKFRAGYTECATEVSRYLSRVDGVDSNVRQCLLNHLAGCMPSGQSPMQTGAPTVISAAAQKYFGNSQVQLVPTRLPSGEIALVLPNSAPLKNEISVNCHTVNVLGSTGILSPAASDRSSVSPLPLMTAVSQPTTPPPMKMEVAMEEPVWRPW